MSKRTPRGFAIFTQFKDAKGGDLRVQKSSEAGVSRCWIFSNGGGGLSEKQRRLHAECAAVGFKMPGSEIINDTTSPYLTRAMARRVAKALLRFADGAE